MCSIFGAFGHFIDRRIVARIRDRGIDRGRDGGRMESFGLEANREAILGAWRATPTTEVEFAPAQPYGGVVHNGTIANDRALGNPIGSVDSWVLQYVIDRESAASVAKSLGEKIVGSYAIGVVSRDRLFLAANYKPIYFFKQRGTVYFSSMERHLAPEMPWGSRPERLRPYSVLDCLTGATAPIKRDGRGGTLVIASSGLDSTTAAYMLRDAGERVGLLHFAYGCNAGSAEHERIMLIAKHLGAPLAIMPIDYSHIGLGSPLFQHNALIANGADGAEYAHEWVPARNLLMIANAVAYAEANGYGAIALGNNLEEAGAYPDNEEEFTNLLNDALDYAVHSGGEVRLISPVGRMMKHEIVKEGLRLGVPYGLTWSCYRDGTVHCGACGPCFMRREAFRRNGAVDPAFDHQLVGSMA